MEPPALLALAVLCAFLMGYAVNQGSTCAVSAAKELVYQGEGTILVGFAIAIGTAGLVCLPLAWLFPDNVHLAGDAGVSGSLILGAMLLGVGAFINDACLFGTLSRIGQGEVRFFALPVGLTFGFFVADRQPWVAAGERTPNLLADPSLLGFLVIAAFALLLMFCLWLLGRKEIQPSHREWPLRRAMVVLGICGALLFSLTPGWTYADAVHRAVTTKEGMRAIDSGVILAAIAALLGALTSGIRARSFHLEKPTANTVTRSLLGGTIMAFGGTLIPGGNDTLLLSSVPSATLSGLTAYATMAATVPLLLLLTRKFLPRRFQQDAPK